MRYKKATLWLLLVMTAILGLIMGIGKHPGPYIMHRKQLPRPYIRLRRSNWALYSGTRWPPCAFHQSILARENEWKLAKDVPKDIKSSKLTAVLKRIWRNDSQPSSRIRNSGSIRNLQFCSMTPAHPIVFHIRHKFSSLQFSAHCHAF